MSLRREDERGGKEMTLTQDEEKKLKDWAREEIIKKYGAYETYLESPEGRVTKEALEIKKSREAYIPIPDVTISRKEPTPEEIEQSKIILRENYDRIIQLFGEYMDISEDNKILNALWVI